MRYRDMTVTSVLVLALSTVGCSALFVKGPPANHTTMDSFECTEGKGWVYYDGLQAAGNAAWALLHAVAPPNDEYGNKMTSEQQAMNIGLGVLFSAIHIGSASAGNKRVERCRAAKAASYMPAPQVVTVTSELTRDDVIDGLRPLYRRVGQCGQGHEIDGVVEVEMTIRPSGRVSLVTPQRGDPSFVSCVQKTLRRARFPRSRSGRDIVYPFRFASSPGDRSIHADGQ